MAKFKGIIKNCEVCGREMKRPQCQSHVKTCSTECGYKLRNESYVHERVIVECAQCGIGFKTFPSHIGRRRFCSEQCRLASPEYRALISKQTSGANNAAFRGATKAVTSMSGKRYHRQAAELESAKLARRRATKHGATPMWANLDAIKMVYKLARAITEQTGIKHHVDHVVPLQSKFVCGLHVEVNLQVIPWLENFRKANRRWSDMP